MNLLLALRAGGLGIFAGLGSHVFEIAPEVSAAAGHVLVGVATALLVYAGYDDPS